jgi:hypothetical protein
VRREREQLPLEVAIALGAFVVVAVEVLVTYSRLPARELYQVSGSGLKGGLSRALVFANVPVALVALAVLGIAYERLRHRAVAIVAAVLCAVFWPGVVSQADLDARSVNAAAAIGVLLTCLLVATAPLAPSARQRGDKARMAIAVPLLLVSLPWFAAELGFFLDGVPLLGRLFETGHYLHNRAGLPQFPPAVHHGHHHGMDGLLLVLTALLLSRTLGSIRERALERRQCIPRAHALLWTREHGERLLDRADLQARLDVVADPECARAAPDGRVGDHRARGRDDLVAQSGSSGIEKPRSRPSSTARVIAFEPNRSRTSSSAASSAS